MGITTKHFSNLRRVDGEFVVDFNDGDPEPFKVQALLMIPGVPGTIAQIAEMLDLIGEALEENGERLDAKADDDFQDLAVLFMSLAARRFRLLGADIHFEQRF